MEICQEDALEATLSLLDKEKVQEGIIDLPLVLDKKYLIPARWERIYHLLNDEYCTLDFKSPPSDSGMFLKRISQVLEQAIKKELPNENCRLLNTNDHTKVKQRINDLLRILSGLTGKPVLLIPDMSSWDSQIFKMIIEIQNNSYKDGQKVLLLFLVLLGKLPPLQIPELRFKAEKNSESSSNEVKAYLDLGTT